MADNKKSTDDLLKAMEQFITTKSVVGEPIVVGETIILPMADVSFGMGIGTFSKGDNGTGGVGGKITPSAVLIIKDGSSKLISVKDNDGISRIIDMVPDIVNKFTSKNDDDYDDDEFYDDDDFADKRLINYYRKIGQNPDLVVKKRNKCIKYIINNKDRKKDA